MWCAAPVLALLVAAAPPRGPGKPEFPLGYVEPPEPAWLSDQGTRWRFTWLFHTNWFISGLAAPDNGPMIGTYLGVGVPVRSAYRLRQEHGFGYAFDILYRGFATNGSHRHRLAATGLVGKRVALFYQAAFGAAWYGFRTTGFEFAGPSVGGRVGIAIGRRRNYIMSIGGDLDIPTRRYVDAVIVVPSINFSLLTVGSL